MASFAETLLRWYDAHRRVLPFRGTHDPYRVWLSEIMLQQTRTETVGAYYTRFLAQFPDVFALAAADEQDVLKAWEGLGYYSRARNLLKAARTVVNDFHGEFPHDAETLRTLSGVGEYTAAAIASIAFDSPAPAMDGNLTRVLSRVYGVREDASMPSTKRKLRELAQAAMPKMRCGEFNQALMDIGATICTPGTPDCEHCPLIAFCDAEKEGDAELLPILPVKQPPKEIFLNVLLLTHKDKIYLTKRRESLLNGLYVYFLTEDEPTIALRKNGLKSAYLRDLGIARHVFTHRIWQMHIYHAEITALPDSMTADFYTLDEMNALPIPTAMRAAKQFAREILNGSEESEVRNER